MFLEIKVNIIYSICYKNLQSIIIRYNLERSFSLKRTEIYLQFEHMSVSKLIFDLQVLSLHSITECTKVLSLHSITECYQSFITTLHHRVYQSFVTTLHRRVCQSLSLHSIAECYQSFFTRFKDFSTNMGLQLPNNVGK